MWETASAQFSKDLWARLRVHGSGIVHGPVRVRGDALAEASRRRHLVLSSGGAFQRDRIRVVHDAIEDRVGDRRLAVRFLFIVASLLAAPSAHAECIQKSAKEVTEGKFYDLLFGGTVVEIARTAELGYRATFDVDRVWKGSVSRRFDLYVWELEPEIPRFEVGHHYLAIARRLVDPRVRQGSGLGGSDTVAFTPVGCSDPFSLAPDIIRGLGEGQLPRRETGLDSSSLGSRAAGRLHNPFRFCGMVSRDGIEPSTRRLRVCCSAN
jgi:hypothetical protein